MFTPCWYNRMFLYQSNSQLFQFLATNTFNSDISYLFADMAYKPGPYGTISPEDMPISPYQAYLPAGAPQAFDYTYHKSMPHPSVDWYQYSQQPSSIPASSSLDGYSPSTGVSSYLSAVSNIWSGSSAPSTGHYPSRYHIK